MSGAEYDETVEEFLKHIENVEKNEHKTKLINVRGLYTMQNPFCPLWISAVHKGATLKAVAERIDYNWIRFKEEGLNANFMTRDIWMKPYELLKYFNITGIILVKDLKIGAQQILDWKLSEEEYIFMFSNEEEYMLRNIIKENCVVDIEKPKVIKMEVG